MTEQRLTEHIMYRAFLRRDPRFDGQFYTAVTTTGVFCRPVCTARKPKRVNLQFFLSPHDALKRGYRPCKICKPLECPGDPPGGIVLLLRELERRPDLRISDALLRQRGIEPRRIRRWFQKHYGMTFQAYQRLRRINEALRDLSAGRKVIEAAFDHGYDSLSGFRHSFKKATARTPRDGRHAGPLTSARIPTPLGPMLAVASDKGICLLEYADSSRLETELGQITKIFQSVVLPGTHPHLEALRLQLGEYFQRTRKSFDLPLVTPGTPFQQKVWRSLGKIGYGETRSYKEQARRCGSPGAVRAVGRANGQNRISILIPCHRVIAHTGDLAGYGGGVWRKRWLLAHERGERADSTGGGQEV